MSEPLQVFRIREENIGQLTQKLEKLGRRATKLGLVPPALVQVGHEDVPLFRHMTAAARAAVQRGERQLSEYPLVEVVRNDDGSFAGVPFPIEGYRRYLLCSIQGEAPTIPGWALVAVIDHTTDQSIGNLIKTVPGYECPKEYRHTEPLCQHCGHIRRRHQTYVLVQDGMFKQIGRNCLADFCRSPEAAHNMAAAAEMYFAALEMAGCAESDEGFGGGGGRVRHDLLNVLTTAAQFIRAMGWISRKTADAEMCQSTAGWVSSYLSPYFKPDNLLRQKLEAAELSLMEDTDLASDAIAWIESKRAEADNLSDYFYNLVVVCTQVAIEPKHFGLACSLIPTYQREMGRLEEAKRPKVVSQHFGTIKKREVFELTVTGISQFPGDFGMRELIRFMDKQGNVAVWWTGSGPETKIGETYRIKATVERHDEWKGVKQTLLKRCNVVAPVVAATSEQVAA